jgi:homoserine dehydrogenase
VVGDVCQVVGDRNKAAIAAKNLELISLSQGEERRLWYSAAVDGAVPALEALAGLNSQVMEIRGTLNGTCGAILHHL